MQCEDSIVRAVLKGRKLFDRLFTKLYKNLV